MKEKSLMEKSLSQFICCVVLLLLLTTPLFYWLTKNFYAEDLIDIIEAVQNGRQIPTLDLERDIMQGVMIQFGFIIAVLGVALVVMMRFISQRLWQPFDKTLQKVEAFKLENGNKPQFGQTGIEEFTRLNTVLDRVITNSLHSYQVQKEFTENASHELQTPLAVFQSKLDLLLQQPDITENQSVIIQDLYQMNGRLSRLSRNLLLLAKMENGQFGCSEEVNVADFLEELMPYIESVAAGLNVVKEFTENPPVIKANRSLFESLINNLVVNAVRHNKTDGTIALTVGKDFVSIANTSDETRLDEKKMFSRFHDTTQGEKGNGLGLAIVKAVCDYHGWTIEYSYSQGIHEFRLTFG